MKVSAIVLHGYCGLISEQDYQTLSVSMVTVLNWIKEAAFKVEPLTGTFSSDAVMINKMRHFEKGAK